MGGQGRPRTWLSVSTACSTDAIPLGTDITARDEIARVADRRGAVLIAGRLRVEAPPQRKHRHIEVTLKKVA